MAVAAVQRFRARRQHRRAAEHDSPLRRLSPLSLSSLSCPHSSTIKSDKVTRHSLDHGRSPCTHDTVRPNPSSRSPYGSIRHTKHSGDGFGIRGNSTRRKGDKHSARAHHRKGTNINRPRAVVQRICLPPLTSLMCLNCNLPLSEGHPARFALQTQVMRRDPRATMSWTNNSKKKKKRSVRDGRNRERKTRKPRPAAV